ncbi:hypothetical protein P7H24_13285 [Enterococcus thailandicus]|uniref:hypothetical protein n=1 Tax=Enterococcus thailandicus TaxID=417368 RepID=UPI00244D89EE|nr:hypothetical protein [Enterococcus thailandicus]MDT2735434.1 hypothetical protein [Enterococcus thailandicus]MDT2793237.1 hypothetical protein [Enterococcus thailandicus]GMC00403.1 hypothetical protein K2F_06620 [Enterococcus thailandicus]
MEIHKLIMSYLNLIDEGLEKKKDPWELAIELEDFVDEQLYDQLKKENPQLLSLMADDIYNITEPLEPGMDSEKFLSELKLFKQKIEANR